MTRETEKTLDPVDWPAFRTLAHRMVDDMLDHLSTLADQPAWREMPESVRASFSAACPREGIGETAAYDAFVRDVMPYTNGNLHPRFWGWVQGNGTPLGMMSDMLAAGINPHMAGFNQAPALVEHEVLRWLTTIVGLPPESTGVLVTGGAMANTLGLAVARQAGGAAAGADIKENGLQSCGARLLFYGSTETHNWATKAAELLGLGRHAFRRVPVDDRFRIDMRALFEMVRADRETGLLPFAVIGNAGTVNTGAIDDLTALAVFAREQRRDRAPRMAAPRHVRLDGSLHRRRPARRHRRRPPIRRSWHRSDAELQGTENLDDPQGAWHAGVGRHHRAERPAGAPPSVADRAVT